MAHFPLRFSLYTIYFMITCINRETQHVFLRPGLYWYSMVLLKYGSDISLY